ncbi:MAG TPA: ATP-binding protein [Streptosporangiaceae bacterium]|nr:ATP-binding protein [Streptosporangiaceae bacterium]
MDGSAWQVLQALPAWQITELPRRVHARSDSADGQDRADRGINQRLQALVSAFHYGSPVAFGWIREHPGGPVRVIAAGPSLAAGTDGAQVVLTFPPGARAEPLPRGRATTLLAGMPCWMQLAGISDALLIGHDEAGRRDRDMRPSLEDGLMSAWSGPFAWLVLAEPVTSGQLGELVAEVSLVQLGAQRSDSPSAQLAAQRLSGRHAELRQATATGLWTVRLMAGGPNPQAAAQVAGLLCASADLDGLPYALVPLPGCAGLDAIPERTAAAVHALPAGASPDPPLAPGSPPSGARARSDLEMTAPAWPFHASSRLVGALARPPVREIPGVRFVLRPDFDVTPEVAIASGNGRGGADPAVPLGTVLDWNRIPAGQLAVPQTSLNRHVFVCGATGAGKSQTVRGLLEAATAAGIPWLVVEPAKAEYQLMAARLPGTEVIRIRPGELADPAAGINPLEPATGPDGTRFPLQTHADLVRALFLASFDADEPFPQVLAAALSRCYENAGWDLVTGEPVRPGVQLGYPTLESLQATAVGVVEEIGYGREITDNVRGFVTVRISSLRQGTTGRFLQGGHPLDFTRLLDANVVLEIEDVGDDRDKAFLMGSVLIRLAEHLRLRQRAEGATPPRLRHLSVFEEAHRLLRQPRAPGGAAAHAVEMFAGLLAEIRAYGEGLIIAEQIPSKLIPDVIKNTAVKIVHRLPAADDRQAVGATMNLTEDQSAYLVTLTPGEAAVFTDGMDYPLLTRMPDGTSRETAGTASAGSPAPLITPRSPTCGPACRAAPCTLRQVRAAQRAATSDPRITLWAELSVLAHLTGWAMPVPGPALADALAAVTSRLRDCAVSHAVDAAVASRVPVISTRISDAALAGHVTAAMRAALDEDRWLCEQHEPQWLAPPYRWALILDSLQALHRRDAQAGPHPRIPEWEAAYGRVIPGPDCASQLETVQRWYDTDQRDQQQVRAVCFGTRPISALEQSAGARCSDPDWEQRLTDALNAFHDCRWPLDYLRPATVGT